MSTPTEQAGSMVLAGATAFAMATGLDPRVMVWAVTGSVFGAALAKPTNSRWYGIAMFLAACMICALVGTAAADTYFGGSHVVRDIIAVLTALGFHPTLGAFLDAIPGLVKWAINNVQRRFGGGTE